MHKYDYRKHSSLVLKKENTYVTKQHLPGEKEATLNFMQGNYKSDLQNIISFYAYKNMNT
jgi:hypothetical protein